MSPIKDVRAGAIARPLPVPEKPCARWVWDQSRARVLMEAIGAYAQHPDWILEYAEQIGQWAIELVENLERIRGVEFDPDAQREEE